MLREVWSGEASLVRLRMGEGLSQIENSWKWCCRLGEQHVGDAEVEGICCVLEAAWDDGKLDWVCDLGDKRWDIFINRH